MKKLHYLGILLLMASASYTALGQSRLMNEMTITPPVYQNTLYNSLNELLQNTLQYPEKSLNFEHQGTEVVRFAISSSGTIENISIINSVSREIDDEVIQVLNSTKGNWKPGTVDGKERTMVKEISLVYALNSIDDLLNTANYYMQKGNKQLIKRDNPEKALKYYEMACSLLPNDPSVLLLKGCCLDQLGLAEDAKINQERISFLVENDRTTSFPESEIFLFADYQTIK